MRIHLRFVALVVVAAGLVGIVLAMTVLNTEESPTVPDPGATSAETGATLDYAQAIPLAVKGPLLGVNLTAYTPDGYGQPDARDDIETLADLGTNTITLVPTWYMDSATGSRIAPLEGKSPTDESLIQAIEWARQAGMQVVLKPHVDVVDDTYRGTIQPVDRERWFRSYLDFIDHYASLASSHGADFFVVGTELKTLSGETERWREVIRQVRDRFVGPITYAANWDEVDQVQFWSELDAIGVDAYYPLTEEGGPPPTLKQLTRAWREIAKDLKAKSEQWDRPVLLTEVGYPSQVGATAKPYEVTDSPADPNIQALAYEATFDALSGADWLEGISWWSWRADPSGDEDLSIDYSPEDKKAQGQLAAGQFTYIG